MFNRLLIVLIQAILWAIDPDHREDTLIRDDNTKRFTHVVPQDFKSDFGTVHSAMRTEVYDAWELQTKNHRLIAADRHRVILANHEPVWVEDLFVGDIILTEDGPQTVTRCRPLGIRTHMYCLQVETDDQDDPHNHLYYSDGILSHNTTCAAGFLLWKAMFTESATILICANKQVQALEIMDRIRFAYEHMPDYIRAGVTEYNKGTIAFDNGSKIVSRATAADSGRGLSITMLYLDEFAFVHPNKAQEFWTAITPVLSTGGGCIVTSTPKNDEDQFAQIWKGARANRDDYGNELPGGIGRNGFFAIEVPWSEHPERTPDWADEWKAKLGEARFLQEFCCVTGDSLVTIRHFDGRIEKVPVERLAHLMGADG